MKINQGTKQLVAGMICLGLLAGCGEKPANNQQKKELPAKNVGVIIGHAQDVKLTRTISGTTEAFQDITISAQGTGEITSISVGTGDRISKGQVLAQIDQEASQAQLNLAKASFNLSRTVYERQKKLLAKELISQQEFDNAETQYQIAKANYDLAVIQFKNTVIDAQFNGFVADKFVEKGELIAAGHPIIRVIDISRIKVSIGLVEEDLASLQAGNKVKVNFPILKRVYEGYVSRVAQATTARSNTYPAEIIVYNQNNTIKPGMLCNVEFVKEVVKNAFLVPQDTIIEEETYKGVFTVKDDIAQLNEVIIAGNFDNKIAIREGVTNGDQIIFSGHKNLVNGDKVIVQEVTNANN